MQLFRLIFKYEFLEKYFPDKIIRALNCENKFKMTEKFEARNPKFETISNIQKTKFKTFFIQVTGFEYLYFEFVSDFDIQI
jgi:hypothetical protein